MATTSEKIREQLSDAEKQLAERKARRNGSARSDKFDPAQHAQVTAEIAALEDARLPALREALAEAEQAEREARDAKTRARINELDARIDPLNLKENRLRMTPPPSNAGTLESVERTVRFYNELLVIVREREPLQIERDDLAATLRY